MAGNFLKLYLSNVYSIGEVEMVSRVNGANLKYRPRMLNTEAKVYSTVDGETEVGSCGIITGRSDYTSIILGLLLTVRKKNIYLFRSLKELFEKKCLYGISMLMSLIFVIGIYFTFLQRIILAMKQLLKVVHSFCTVTELKGTWCTSQTWILETSAITLLKSRYIEFI